MHAGRGEDIVAEVLIRAGSDGGARRGVERALEGWSLQSGPCALSRLQSLKDIFSRKVIDRVCLDLSSPFAFSHPKPQIAPDPTTNISFNLNLTPAQQESRSQVPLPYAHEGNDPNFHPRGKPPSQGCGSSPVIIYDPDSADDIDDDDPDEDLDI
jgi:elongator complex protein 5